MGVVELLSILVFLSMACMAFVANYMVSRPKYYLLERYKHYLKYKNNDKKDDFVFLQIDAIIAMFSKLPDYNANPDFYAFGNNKEQYDSIKTSEKYLKILGILLVVFSLTLIAYLIIAGNK